MKVLLYGGTPFYAGFNRKFGGTARLVRATVKALKAVGVDLTYCSRKTYLKGKTHDHGEFDIVHCDDTTTLQGLCRTGQIPHVVGPMPRSMYKTYKSGKKNVSYPGYEGNPAKMYDDMRWIRNSWAEEGRYAPQEVLDKITIVFPGIEVDEIKPPEVEGKRNLVVWAGARGRWAKNWEFFQKVKKATTLPEGYEWRVLTNYTLQNYLDVLDRAALVVNTSRVESFCYQLFEAWAKGVPAIYRKSLWGGGEELLDEMTPFISREYQVELIGCPYDTLSYAAGINAWLKNILEIRPTWRAIAGGHFSTEAHGRRLLAVYEEVLG